MRVLISFIGACGPAALMSWFWRRARAARKEKQKLLGVLPFFFFLGLRRCTEDIPASVHIGQFIHQ